MEIQFPPDQVFLLPSEIFFILYGILRGEWALATAANFLINQNKCIKMGKSLPCTGFNQCHESVCMALKMRYTK